MLCTIIVFFLKKKKAHVYETNSHSCKKVAVCTGCARLPWGGQTAMAWDLKETSAHKRRYRQNKQLFAKAETGAHPWRGADKAL